MVTASAALTTLVTVVSSAGRLEQRLFSLAAPRAPPARPRQLGARAVLEPLSLLPRGFRSRMRTRHGRATVLAAACGADARGVRLGPRSLTPFHPHPLAPLISSGALGKAPHDIRA